MTIQESLERWIINNPKQVILVIIVLIITIVFAIFGLILALIVIGVLAKENKNIRKKETTEIEEKVEPKVIEKEELTNIIKTHADEIKEKIENVIKSGNDGKEKLSNFIITNSQPLSIKWGWWTTYSIIFDDNVKQYYIEDNNVKYYIYKKDNKWYFIDIYYNRYTLIKE